MKVISKVNITKKPPKQFDKKSKTEKAGYIPPKVQIENMILAGERLDAYRKEMYQAETDDSEEPEIDPTRNPNFDLADASRISRSLEQKAEQVATANAEVKIKAEEKKKRQLDDIKRKAKLYDESQNKD